MLPLRKQWRNRRLNAYRKKRYNPRQKRPLELLKKFPGYPALYIGNGGSTFSPDTAIHIRGNAVLYKNPYFKQSKMKS